VVVLSHGGSVVSVETCCMTSRAHVILRPFPPNYETGSWYIRCSQSLFCWDGAVATLHFSTLEILARQPRDDKHLNKRLNAIYPRARRLLRLEPYKTHTVCTYAFCKANPPDYNGTGDWTGSHHVIISDIGTFESMAQMEEWGGGLNAWRASARHGERTPSFLSLGPSFCDNQDQG
jgi:hypothetical protein